MKAIGSNDLRKKFLEFFKKKGHKIIAPASLIPENDPTVLFTTAGMHPLVPYLIGENHPEGKRLVNIQPCIRTDDIDEVGDAVHHTFFEMMGNWSLGEYFKKEAIEMSLEFLTSKKWLGLDKNKLAISIFEGDNDAPRDDESEKIWLELGISQKRIKGLAKKDNWWGPAGQTGPCGPDTEMFYWTGKEDTPEKFNPSDKRWVEIWNDVFMEYYKKEDRAYEPLKQKNVDTGMGLERMLAVLNNNDDNYQADIFFPTIRKLEELSGKKYEDNKKEFRVIADHIKAAVFIIGDERGAEPSNIGQGYVARRLLRRAIRYGRLLGLSDHFLTSLIKEVAAVYKDAYPRIKKQETDTITIIQKEEERFKQILEEGLKKVEKIIAEKVSLGEGVYTKIMTVGNKKEIFRNLYSNKAKNNEFAKSGIAVTNDEIFKATITGKEAFDMYQTHGFPVEMIVELAQAKNLFVDIEDFKSEEKKHQELSRTASAGMFKGGLADAGKAAIKYHTATHLLLASLRQVLGPKIYQKGSNINAERLRFDFNYPQKLTSKQIREVEDLVNKKIKEGIEVENIEMKKNEAIKKVQVSFDESKYGDVVKVYRIGDFSTELCGGPHVKNTKELGEFKITKEESSSAGIRRIKAVLR